MSILERMEKCIYVHVLKIQVSQLQHDEQFQNLAEPIKVLLVDTELANIYDQSRKGESDFRDYSQRIILIGNMIENN